MRAVGMVGLGLAVATMGLSACKKDEAKPNAPAPAGAPVADAGAAALAQFPARKPGLWEQTISMAQGQKMVSRLCLDAATDAKLSIQGQQLAGAQCSKQTVSKGADGAYSFASTCSMGTGGTVTSSGKASGDFNTAYKVEADTQVTGAGAPQMNRSAKVTIDAKWVGPCPAGWTPGDVELPGGTRINTVASLETLQGAAAAK